MTQQREWEKYNDTIYPPASDDNKKRRPAEIHIFHDKIMYSQKKLWFLGYLVRGLSVDEALTQLGFRPEKGARFLEDAIQEGMRKAVEEEQMEFDSNLWVEDVRVLRGLMIPGVWKGARRNAYQRHYHFADLLVRLQGDPPSYYQPAQRRLQELRTAVL